jgi:hypothetical protein
MSDAVDDLDKLRIILICAPEDADDLVERTRRYPMIDVQTNPDVERGTVQVAHLPMP